MTDYLLLFITITIIYYVLIHNKPARKTDWETLPFLDAYKKKEKAVNEVGEICCIYCSHQKMVRRLLNSSKENPNNSKHYHACTNCKVILWRSESVQDKKED